MAHTKECRDRVRGLIEDSGESETLARAVLRRNEFLSEQVEKGDSALHGGGGDPGSSTRGGVTTEAVPDEPAEVPVPDSDIEDSEGGKNGEKDAEKDAKRRTSSKYPDLNSPKDCNPPAKRAKHGESEITESKESKNSKTSKRHKDNAKDEQQRKRRKEEEETKQDMDNAFVEEILSLNNFEANIWKTDWINQNPMNKSSWNIEDEITQKKCIHLLHVHKPHFVLCEAISKISSKWKNPTQVNSFINKVCEVQRRADRRFISYQDLNAPRWACVPWEKTWKKSDVKQVGVHLDVTGGGKGLRLTTNSEQIIEAIRERTNLSFEEKIQKGCEVSERQKNQKYNTLHLNSSGSLHYEDTCGNFVDDTTGSVLDKKETLKARALEMETFKIMEVYSYVSREKALKDKDGKIVGVRWVDVQKGLLVRSRLVAQEFAGNEEREDIFAATPPLFATKIVISDAASRGDYGRGDRCLLILDVKRAFLYGDIEDSVYIELPVEDPYYGQGYVGVLKKAMYGTRGAPRVWQKVVKKVMTSLGFVMNPIHPCVYHHPEKDILVVTHVDDFLCSGNRVDLRWLSKEISKEFEIKSDMLGSREDEVRECQFLGRTIRWTEQGYEYEGNPKHANILLDEWDMKDAKTLSSPGVATEKPNMSTKTEEEHPLDAVESKSYRRAAARINYMSLDRADLSFASKEASRGMSRPTVGDVVRLKRILRYLKGHRRAVNVFHWQKPQHVIMGLCDSDWAGCSRTRKSTSGGVVLLGKHLISHWSSTQTVIALSSAEAELNAVVKIVSETLGVRNLFKSMNKEKQIIIKTDSSACNGIVHREGCGKVKHLEVRQLWVQDLVGEKVVRIQKVPREYNCSDCLTHHWSAVDGLKHFQNIGLEFK